MQFQPEAGKPELQHFKQDLTKLNIYLVYTVLSCQDPVCSFHIFSKKSLLQQLFKNVFFLLKQNTISNK